MQQIQYPPQYQQYEQQVPLSPEEEEYYYQRYQQQQPYYYDDDEVPPSYAYQKQPPQQQYRQPQPPQQQYRQQPQYPPQYQQQYVEEYTPTESDQSSDQYYYYENESQVSSGIPQNYHAQDPNPVQQQVVPPINGEFPGYTPLKFQRMAQNKATYKPPEMPFPQGPQGPAPKKNTFTVSSATNKAPGGGGGFLDGFSQQPAPTPTGKKLIKGGGSQPGTPSGSQTPYLNTPTDSGANTPIQYDSPAQAGSTRLGGAPYATKMPNHLLPAAGMATGTAEAQRGRASVASANDSLASVASGASDADSVVGFKGMGALSEQKPEPKKGKARGPYEPPSIARSSVDGGDSVASVLRGSELGTDYHPEAPTRKGKGTYEPIAGKQGRSHMVPGMGIPGAAPFYEQERIKAEEEAEAAAAAAKPRQPLKPAPFGVDPVLKKGEVPPSPAPTISASETAPWSRDDQSSRRSGRARVTAASQANAGSTGGPAPFAMPLVDGSARPQNKEHHTPGSAGARGVSDGVKGVLGGKGYYKGGETEQQVPSSTRRGTSSAAPTNPMQVDFSGPYAPGAKTGNPYAVGDRPMVKRAEIK